MEFCSSFLVTVTWKKHVDGDDFPNDEFASKAASHDLKGANQYFRVFFDKIEQILLKQNQVQVDQQQADPTASELKSIPRVPMQAVMDYLGYRLTAMDLVMLVSRLHAVMQLSMPL